MPSNFTTFEAIIDNGNGSTTPVPSTSIKAWDTVADVDLGAVATSDANGIVAGGTVAVAAGTRVRFRIENFHGRAGYEEQVTT
jgi:hypothetical protein